MAAYHLIPSTGRAAMKWIAATHRHLPKLQGALFAVGVAIGDRQVGVATAGNPPRVWQGTGRFVITRCAVQSELPGVGEHAAPACTMLYSALCRAGKALGYREAWTYTLAHEPGTSLIAAGFEFMGLTDADADWQREGRSSAAPVCDGPKKRWRRVLVLNRQRAPSGEDQHHHLERNNGE